MLIVKKGESGPHVLALQILFNRFKPRGIVLKTDGVWGDRTAEAIRAFREDVMHTSGPDDQAEGPVCQRLVFGANLQVIDAVDITDPMLLDNTVPEVAQFTNPILTGGMSGGLSQVLGDIKGRANGPKSILLLRFHAHGGPGIVAVSIGSRKVSPGIDGAKEQAILNPQTIKILKQQIESLKPFFCDFGLVQLHACKVAREPKGLSMIGNLADMLGVPVMAGLVSQSSEGKANFYLSPPYTTAFPGGVDLRVWAAARKESNINGKRAA